MTDIDIQPGSIVSCRSRQWVVLPSENLDVVRLRSLSGNEDEITGIFRQLLEMNLQAIAGATFPLPSASQVKDHAAAQLLMEHGCCCEAVRGLFAVWGDYRCVLVPIN
jgi:hypothetical protein